MRNNGTTYQAKDRWNTGNFVRFHQDTIQPIGGWTKRTLTSGSTHTAGAFIIGRSYTIASAGTTNFTTIGAANSNVGTTFTATGQGTGTGTATANISGVVSATHTWSDAAGLTWIAIGTTAGVFVVKNSTNVLYDITPKSFYGTYPMPINTAIWSFDNYGGWLVMSASSNDFGQGVAGFGYPSVWKCNTATAAVQCDTAYTDSATLQGSAYSVGGVVTTPERFFMCLRGIPYPTGTTVPTYYADS